MQFVVPIPLWLYAICILAVFSVGLKIFAGVMLLGFIYFLLTQPRQTLSVIATLAILLLFIEYWKVAVPLAIILTIISCIKDELKEDGKEQAETQLMSTTNNAQAGSKEMSTKKK